MIVFLAMECSLYSVRMRASNRGCHVCGAERIVAESEVSKLAADLTQRALRAGNGKPDEVHCTVERIAAEAISYFSLPDITINLVDNYREGRALAEQLLMNAGVNRPVACQAVSLLATGAGPGGQVMRGAVIMDMASGQRLEEDPARGVRVSRMDLTSNCRAELEPLLSAADLGHRRVVEALTLAGKVMRAPGIVAELCWSDDPHYTTGYVAAPQFGYQRISALKEQGDPLGGRVLFVDTGLVDLKEFVDYLELRPVLFEEIGQIFPAQDRGADHA